MSGRLEKNRVRLIRLGDRKADQALREGPSFWVNAAKELRFASQNLWTEALSMMHFGARCGGHLPRWICRLVVLGRERCFFRGGTPNDAITASLVRTRFALGPSVPTLRRLTRAPSIRRTSASASKSGCDAPAAPHSLARRSRWRTLNSSITLSPGWPSSVSSTAAFARSQPRSSSAINFAAFSTKP